MKRVLIIDATGCRYCPAIEFGPDGLFECGVLHKSFSDAMSIQISNPKTARGVRPFWCPLKDLPEYKMDWSSKEDSYEAGWNDVLDAIGAER